MDINKILLIGAGKMGGALVSGWLSNGLSPAQIMVLDPFPSSEVEALDLVLNPSIDAIVAAQPEIIVLAVKPQIAADILSDIAPTLPASSLVLSIMAGLSLDRLETLTGVKSIVRTMPNTPASLGVGASVLIASASVSELQKKLAEGLMTAVGSTAWIDNEVLMDAVTAISGSGPAYVFHFVEALAKAGETLGLDSALSMRLARQTVAGAGQMLSAFDQSATELRENVTSPNGTTQAALEVLMQPEALTLLLEKTTAAAAQRSRELSEE